MTQTMALIQPHLEYIFPGPEDIFHERLAYPLVGAPVVARTRTGRSVFRLLCSCQSTTQGPD